MRFLQPQVFVAPLALLLMAAGALGQGIVDVQNDPASTTGFGCGSDVILNGTILQSFVPHEDTLIAAELRLQAGSAFPAEGYVTTARLRADTPAGPALAEATASVAGAMRRPGPQGHWSKEGARFRGLLFEGLDIAVHVVRARAHPGGEPRAAFETRVSDDG